MSRTKLIRQLERRHAELIESIVGTEEMIRGSFGTVYRKCGKSGCRCARGKGHPLDRITFTEGEVSRSRAVPRGEVSWVKKMVENRKKFRGSRRELRAVEKELQREISELEAEITSRSAGKKAWLKQGFVRKIRPQGEFREK